MYLAIESLLSCSLVYNQTLLNHCYINKHIAASLLWVECITPPLTVVLPYRGTSTGWWESHEVQQEVQSPAPEEEQPQAPVCAGEQRTGKMLGQKNPGGPCGARSHLQAIFPCLPLLKKQWQSLRGGCKLKLSPPLCTTILRELLWGFCPLEVWAFHYLSLLFSIFFFSHPLLLIFPSF